MSPQIYPITRENSSRTIPDALRLIRSLAEFEKAADKVEATEEQLAKSLLGETNYASGVLIYTNGSPDDADSECIAMAIFYYSFSTWTSKGGLYLEDLFVEEAYRKQGLARMLFKYLANICLEKDLSRFEWAVLDWNVNAKAVYEKMGAKPNKGWDIMRVAGDGIKQLAES